MPFLSKPPATVTLWPVPADGPLRLSDEQALGPMLQRWRDWCEANPGQAVHLALSSRCFLQTVVRVSPGQRAAQAWAQACAHWLHWLGQDFQPERWLWRAMPLPMPAGRRAAPEPTRTGLAWLVLAWPAAWRDDLLGVAHAHGVRVCGITPWWAPLCDAMVRSEAAWQLDDADWCLRWHRQGPAEQWLQCMPSHAGHVGHEGHEAADGPPPHDPGSRWQVQGPQGPAGLGTEPWRTPQTEPGWRRWLARTNVPQALDFLARVEPTAPWAWGVLLLGAAALGGVLHQHAQATQAVEALETQQRRLNQAEHRLRLARAVAQPADATQPEAVAAWSDAHLLAAQPVMTRLAWPWAQWLAHSTQGVDATRVRLLRWSLDLRELPTHVAPHATVGLVATTDDALMPWLQAQPGTTWLSREALAEPLWAPAGQFRVKAQLERPLVWRPQAESEATP